MTQQDGQGQQPPVDAVAWAPMFGETALGKRVKAWTSFGIAAAILAVAAAVLIAAGDSDRQLALFGIAAAIGTGFVLIGAGVGLLCGEALRAEDVRPGSGGRYLYEPEAGDWAAKVLAALKDALGGLSPARVLLFLGTVLLVAGATTAVVASQILETDPEAGQETTQTPSTNDPAPADDDPSVPAEAPTTP